MGLVPLPPFPAAETVARFTFGWPNGCFAAPGRMNMRAVDITVQNLIGSGMNPKTENDPYLGFVYTSFQERATKVRVKRVGIPVMQVLDRPTETSIGSLV